MSALHPTSDREIDTLPAESEDEGEGQGLEDAILAVERNLHISVPAEEAQRKHIKEMRRAARRERRLRRADRKQRRIEREAYVLMSWKDNQLRKDVVKGKYSDGEKACILPGVLHYAMRKKLSTVSFDWLLQKGSRGAVMAISSATLPDRKYSSVYAFLKRSLVALAAEAEAAASAARRA